MCPKLFQANRDKRYLTKLSSIQDLCTYLEILLSAIWTTKLFIVLDDREKFLILGVKLVINVILGRLYSNWVRNALHCDQYCTVWATYDIIILPTGGGSNDGFVKNTYRLRTWT